jgi:Gti1/Pac2 family
MEWTIWEEDGFEVGEAINGSRLRKKTISISTRGRTHHIVSYYTAYDAQTLARPSKELDLGPFSNLVPSFHFHKEMVLPHRRHDHQRQRSPTNTLYSYTFSKCFEDFGSKST